MSDESYSITLELRLIKKFGGKIPEVGDEVCTCTYEHGIITEKIDLDTVMVKSGERISKCSLWHCCDRVDHEWEHPSRAELDAFYDKAAKGLV